MHVGSIRSVPSGTLVRPLSCYRRREWMPLRYVGQRKGRGRKDRQGEIKWPDVLLMPTDDQSVLRIGP